MITPITYKLYQNKYNNSHKTKNSISFNARIGVPVNMEKKIIDGIVKGEISKHFVPTPILVIDKMINALGTIKPNERILEPSAGYGHIADRLVERTSLAPSKIDVIEPIPSLRKVLDNKGYNLVDYDILKYQPDYQYDKIIMNPPYDNGSDILHLLHCHDLLKKGGKLVCILPENDFIPSKQPGYEKWLKDWFGNGELREINEYLEDLLKNNEHRVEKLGKVFHNSDVPDDIETRMVLITKR
jgi:hypothetical protein